MSATAITCPQCQVRLRVGSVAEGQSFSCPKCGHLVHAGGGGGAGSGHKGLLIGLIAAVLLTGGGIIAAIVMTRTPAEKVPDASQTSAKVDEGALAKEKERLAADEKAKKANDDKRRQDYGRWMSEGGAAAGAQKWAEAMIAYEEALKAMPGDEFATKKAAEAKAALDALAQSKVTDEKTQEDFKKLMEQANAARANKEYAAAAEIYKLALQKSPGDADAAKGLAAALEGIGSSQAEQKKQEDFQRNLAAAQAAFKAGRYGDALASAIAAQQILPKNAQAAAVQRDAQRKLDQEKDRKEQRADFDRFVDLGATALRNNDFKGAADAFNKALKILPDDAVAKKGLDDAAKGAKNGQFEFDLAMAKGNAAMRDARFKDAADAFRDALRAQPGNADAQRGLVAAEAAYANRAGYIRAMQRGNLALGNLLFADAIVAFNDALRLVPGDPLAAAGLLEAQTGLAEAQRLQVKFDEKVKAGISAKNMRKFDDAARAFKDALKIFPGSPQADNVRILFRYSEAMSEGTKALMARNKKEALRQFQRALDEIPNDPVARAAFIQAQNLPANKI